MPPDPDFNDAWSEWSGMYSSVANEMSWLNSDISALLSSANWAILRTNTFRCFVHLRNAFIAHVSPGGFGADAMDSSHYASTYYAWVGVPAAEIDMGAILLAMWDAAPHQVLLLIAILDAMKTSVWEKTFDETTMARYIRHFAE